MFGVATIFTGSQLQTLILEEHLRSQIHSSSFDGTDTQSLFFVRIVPWVSRRLEKFIYEIIGSLKGLLLLSSL